MVQCKLDAILRERLHPLFVQVNAIFHMKDVGGAYIDVRPLLC